MASSTRPTRPVRRGLRHGSPRGHASGSPRARSQSAICAVRWSVPESRRAVRSPRRAAGSHRAGTRPAPAPPRRPRPYRPPRGHLGMGQGGLGPSWISRETMTRCCATPSAFSFDRVRSWARTARSSSAPVTSSSIAGSGRRGPAGTMPSRPGAVLIGSRRPRRSRTLAASPERSPEPAPPDRPAPAPEGRPDPAPPARPDPLPAGRPLPLAAERPPPLSVVRPAPAPRVPGGPARPADCPSARDGPERPGRSRLTGPARGPSPTCAARGRPPVLPDPRGGECQIGLVPYTHPRRCGGAPATTEPPRATRQNNAPHRISPGGHCQHVRLRPTLPHRHQCSTIGAEGVSLRVRNGAGRFPRYDSRNSMEISIVPDRISGTTQWTRSIFVISYRPISTGQLHALPHFHIRPINPVV